MMSRYDNKALLQFHGKTDDEGMAIGVIENHPVSLATLTTPDICSPFGPLFCRISVRTLSLRKWTTGRLFYV